MFKHGIWSRGGPFRCSFLTWGYQVVLYGKQASEPLMAGKTDGGPRGLSAAFDGRLEFQLARWPLKVGG